MRLGFDARILEAGFSGVRTIAGNLLEGLRLSASDDDQIVTFGRTDAADVRLDGTGFMHIKLPRAASRRVDAIVVPRQASPLVSPVPVIPVFQDIGFLRRPDIYSAKRPVLYANRLAMRCVASASISDFTSREVQAINPYPVDPPSPLPFGAMRTVLRKPSRDHPFILTIAAQQPNKNLEQLIRAWCDADTVNFRLVLCGKPGESSRSIRALVDKQGCSNVQVIGPVSDEDLEDLMASCTGYIQPSLYEGLCIPALDAAASGCPVVVSDRGPLRDLFTGCPDGILVDPESTRSIQLGLERLMHDSAFRDTASEWSARSIAVTDATNVGRALWQVAKS